MFEPGHLVLRRTRSIGKLEPRRDGPYEVRATSGQLRQRVTIRRVADGREYTVLARRLVPYLEDLALTPAEVSDLDEACPPLDFEDDDAGSSPKRAKAAPKHKRGRPRKEPLE